MIVYGTRASHLKTAQLSHVECPNCGTAGSLTASVFAKYAHIFWIPVFSIGRTGASQCQHCKQVVEEKGMSHSVSAAYKHLLNETRVPIWNFAGLALLAVLIAYGSYASGETAKKEQAYLNDPKPGDLYEVKTNDGNYTSFRVEAVNGDSLLISWNNYAVNKTTGLNDIEKDENYAEPVSWARTELANLDRERSIHHIYRKGNR